MEIVTDVLCSVQPLLAGLVSRAVQTKPHTAILLVVSALYTCYSFTYHISSSGWATITDLQTLSTLNVISYSFLKVIRREGLV